MWYYILVTRKPLKKKGGSRMKKIPKVVKSSLKRWKSPIKKILMELFTEIIKRLAIKLLGL